MAKRKIAILGGGIGSLTTAYYLSRTEALRDRYDLTVYQLGWRLGGKGASGRSLVPDEHLRIEEHGLHLWFGFYDNSFRALQEIYERKPSLPDDRLVTWRDAFAGQSLTPLGEDYDGKLGYWPFQWATNAGVPGDGDVALSPEAAITELASIVRRVVRMMFSNASATSSGWRDLFDNLGDFAVAGGYGALLAALEVFEDLTETPLPSLAVHHGPIAKVVAALRKWLQGKAHDRLHDDEFRRYYCVLELGLTTLLGLLDPKYGIVTDPDFDLDRIDHLDFRAWLLENGADPWVVNESSYLRALYDLPFAYEDGDIDKPGFAAGAAVRVLLRLILTYKENFYFTMQAGMGEAVVAPFYEVLREQGVKFEFFQKVTNLELSQTEQWVERVHLEQQVELKTGAYDPVFRVDGITCWPSEPFWDQIVDGEAIGDRLRAERSSLESHWCTDKVSTRVLELGVDFDQVVLGISLGAFKDLGNGEPNLGDALRAHSPKFRTMSEKTGIVPTQSFQIWTKEDLAGLGWRQPEMGAPAMNGAPEPYSVWADSSHVINKEPWGPGGPRGVFYFCGPWKNDLTRRPSTDSGVPQAAYDDVLQQATHCVSHYTGYLWPDARDPSNPAGLDWDALFDPRAQSGADRMRYQWIRPNVDPTETCALTLAGTTQHRLEPGESGYLNLFLTGAWTRTSINTTCVEAATMSGMKCARAITEEAARHRRRVLLSEEAVGEGAETHLFAHRPPSLGARLLSRPQRASGRRGCVGPQTASGYGQRWRGPRADRPPRRPRRTLH